MMRVATAIRIAFRIRCFFICLDYEAALKTLDSIPPEVIRFYENRTQESVVRHDK